MEPDCCGVDGGSQGLGRLGEGTAFDVHQLEDVRIGGAETLGLHDAAATALVDIRFCDRFFACAFDDSTTSALSGCIDDRVSVKAKQPTDDPRRVLKGVGALDGAEGDPLEEIVDLLRRHACANEREKSRPVLAESLRDEVGISRRHVGHFTRFWPTGIHT